ncbi:flagellar operon protein [Geosporobacter subterraneus DSM 17957]|uniref:Flagellar operon protein n=1 Tax=Geosporobacter subterraneus DSM 17957 TaxID=1121919 RepID=A0A1M6E4H1_9FIRM|nr:TIGR02530 family flagellar biosynthesis protein [Geosporobacter subterraneus]SHI80283.1 flagellar operon protein [Geosporobacter subterraneus DSM 17957]
MNKVIIQSGKPIQLQNNKTIGNPSSGSKPFAQLLEQIVQNQEVKFSKHALQRLEARNIHLDVTAIDKINEALNKAKQKGIKETLILMDNKAFVASVKNKTIITAATDDQLKESVFTNIDGAVII